MDTIKTNQIEIGGKLLNIEPKKLGGNVQINLVGDVSGSVDTPVEAGSTINITTKLEKEVPEGGNGIFKVIPGSDLLGLTPTPFTEIIEAVMAGKHLVVDFSISQGSTYNITGGVSEFSYNEETHKGAITCYMLMEMPDYCLEPMRYVFSGSYDASASPTDTWTTAQPMPIYSPTMSGMNPEDMVPSVAKIYGNEYAIKFNLPTVTPIKHTSTTPYDDFTRIASAGSIPVFNGQSRPYFYMGSSSVESHAGLIFGCICQDVNGTLYMLKKVLQTDNTWYTSSTKFPIGGGQLIPPEFFSEENAGKAVVINEAGTGLELAGPFASKEYVDGIVGEVETQLSEL